MRPKQKTRGEEVWWEIFAFLIKGKTEFYFHLWITFLEFSLSKYLEAIRMKAVC